MLLNRPLTDGADPAPVGTVHGVTSHGVRLRSHAARVAIHQPTVRRIAEWGQFSQEITSSTSKSWQQSEQRHQGDRTITREEPQKGQG